ncbi:hypothetical protein LCGC14_0018530 [marine sediment metagenome]|uniref:Uncharacterized protein n=1 Tax=marine sediment metagenome TaxID=412755 RepID=A0A0F9YGL9_9ZZZZ
MQSSTSRHGPEWRLTRLAKRVLVDLPALVLYNGALLQQDEQT